MRTMQQENNTQRMMCLWGKACCRMALFIVLMGYTAVQARHYRTVVYSEENGLPSSDVKDMAQDHQGRMWFATRNGIAVYDGVNWTHFGPDTGLPAVNYAKILCDQDGGIWAAADGSQGLISYYIDNEWLHLPPLPVPAGRGYDIAMEVVNVAGQPRLAVAVGDMGLFWWRDDDWHQLPLSGELAGMDIHDLLSHQGKLFAATSVGLLEVEETTASLIYRGNALFLLLGGPSTQNPSKTVLWAWDGASIVAWENHRFVPIAETEFDFQEDSKPLGFAQTRDTVFYSKKNQLFMLDLATNKNQRLGIPNGFAAEGATEIFIDREGILWVTGTRGVTKVPSFRFTNYHQDDGLQEDEVSAAIEWTPGRIVVGQNQSIALLQDDLVKVIESWHTGPNQGVVRIMDFAHDDHGNLWVAGSELGLGLLRPDLTLTWQADFMNTRDRVVALAMGPGGSLWIGTNRGLFRKDADRFEYINGQSGKIPYNIRKLALDADGTVFAATAGDGLLKITGNRVEEFMHPDIDRANNVYTVFVDHLRTVWVGTLAGLFQFREGQLRKAEVPSLSHSRPVYLLFQDLENRLWIGTNNGIIRWDREQGSRWFTQKDGLSGLETNRSAGLASRSGDVWIGLESGISHYQDRYDQAIKPPHLMIEKLETNLTDLPLDKRQSLSHEHNNLFVSFLCISFVQEQNIQYQTMLEGYEEEWLEEAAYHGHPIRFTNLSPGTYRLHIRARNLGGPWSEAVTTQWITIRKPFWLTWWFLATACLAFVGLIFAVFQQLNTRRVSRFLRSQVKAKTAELEEKTHQLEDKNTRLLHELGQREQIERQLHQAKEKAEAGSRAKSEFLATMSHEIRTPLNGVIATANLLRDTSLDKDQAEYAEIISLSGEALLAVISDILDFSKIESGEIETVCVAFDPRQMIKDIARILANRALEQKTRIHTSITENVPHEVMGDPDRLRQVLLNLAGNALKFTSAGHVYISLEVVSTQPMVLRFEVRDTGIGIPPEKINQLFKPFSQLNSALNRKFSGTGLGLAITKRLVEIMGGEVGVVSEPEKGSTFFFTMTIDSAPLHGEDSSRVKSQAVPAKPRDYSNIKILAAEDNPINQKILKRVLQNLGAAVDMTGDGIEALKAIREKEYDIIFMDIQMPGMDGIEATTRIIAEQPLHKRPRIIACTANATEEERERCLDSGMNDFLVKPLEKEKIVAILDKWTGDHDARIGPKEELRATSIPGSGA